MPGVEAARWNTVCEQGGAWRRVLVRRDSEGNTLPLAAPCRHVVYPVTVDETPGTPVIDYAPTLAGDQKSAVLLITPEQIAALDPAQSYRHKIIVTDPAVSQPIVLLRGWFRVQGDGGTL
jgi:hypothetical protein